MKKPLIKGMLSKKAVTEQAKKINLPLLVRQQAYVREIGVAQVSSLMGFDRSHLGKAIKKKEHHISLLIALSVHLQKNFLEPYLVLLPETLRATRRETEQATQILALQKQLDEVTKERDLFKEAVLRK